ncbi:MAG: glycoside hydrolase family 3 protein [Leptospiraceae bacterium]|nr:glycoside hydrolase family 3 protein [Leptospiraceae bacterium]
MKTTLQILTIILLFSQLTCSFLKSEEVKSIPKEKIHRFATKILNGMSDEEKAGQVIHIAVPGREVDEETIEEIQKIKPGGVILFGYNLGSKSQIKNLTKSLQAEVRNLKLPPLFISTDQEGGRVVRVEKGVTSFPGAMALGQNNNNANTYNVGLVTSYQLNRLGINVVFAPSLDINNNPDNPVINTRSFGSTVEIVTKWGTMYEQGARDGGALPVIKHFPGHGDTNVDSHLGLPQIQKTEKELEDFELIPFKTAISKGAKAVMSAHIVFPKIDSEYPATLSEKILTKILREKLKFSGLVFTDAMEMDAISKSYKNVKRGTLAILAGADVVLLTSFGKNTIEYRNMILESMRKDEFIRDGVNVLDEAIHRQICLKIEQGLFDSETSFFKIEDEEIKSFLASRNKIAIDKYEAIKKQGLEELNRKVSIDAVKSYKKYFTPPKPEVVKTFKFVIKNDRMKEDLELFDIEPITEKKFKKLLKSKVRANYVIDTKDQNDLNKVEKIIRANPNSNFIILHYGSPFLVLPQQENVDILFSFSPTDISLSSLILRLLNSNPDNLIQTTDLILK